MLREVFGEELPPEPDSNELSVIHVWGQLEVLGLVCPLRRNPSSERDGPQPYSVVANQCSSMLTMQSGSSEHTWVVSSITMAVP